MVLEVVKSANDRVTIRNVSEVGIRGLNCEVVVYKVTIVLPVNLDCRLEGLNTVSLLATEVASIATRVTCHREVCLSGKEFI